MTGDEDLSDEATVSRWSALRPGLREAGRVIGTVSLSLLFAVTLSMTGTLLPGGGSGVDNLIYSALSFPLVWIALSLWLLAARRRGRAFGIATALAAASAAIVIVRAAT